MPRDEETDRLSDRIRYEHIVTAARDLALMTNGHTRADLDSDMMLRKSYRSCDSGDRRGGRSNDGWRPFSCSVFAMGQHRSDAPHHGSRLLGSRFKSSLERGDATCAGTSRACRAGNCQTSAAARRKPLGNRFFEKGKTMAKKKTDTRNAAMNKRIKARDAVTLSKIVDLADTVSSNAFKAKEISVAIPTRSRSNTIWNKKQRILQMGDAQANPRAFQSQSGQAVHADAPARQHHQGVHRR